ncbi:MAG: adenylate cyclase [Pseudonocardiales bacterium]|nr:adenylate cyclase [Pseudonocardiales bacterium]
MANVVSTRREIEDPALAVELAGLRFRDAVTEANFRRWFALEAMPFARLAVGASAIGWFIALVGLGIGIPGTFWPTSGWVLGAIVPLLGIAFWATFHPGRRMLVVGGCVNAVGGVIAIWPISFHALDSPHLASFVAIIFALFAFTIFRLPPLVAAPAVAVYLVLHQVLILHAHAQGDLSAEETWIDSLIPWIAYLTGLLVCCVLSALSRDAYRRERVIDKQQQVIEAERERSDALLRNVLPDQVADRLKNSDEPIADFFPEVTVLFADIVGFTGLATRLPPRELVAMLGDVFSRLDTLTAARGAEKIKTIGDAYMAVAGVPEPRADHVETMADLALDMRDAIAGMEQHTGLAVVCRFGLATGPAVAGVIGQQRFAYDLWGNTVNLAARMESHGVAGRIQVTAEVHERLTSTHILEARGSVDIKGAGRMETWFLEGRAASEQAAPEAPADPSTAQVLDQQG